MSGTNNSLSWTVDGTSPEEVQSIEGTDVVNNVDVICSGLSSASSAEEISTIATHVAQQFDCIDSEARRRMFYNLLDVYDVAATEKGEGHGKVLNGVAQIFARGHPYAPAEDYLEMDVLDRLFDRGTVVSPAVHLAAELSKTHPDETATHIDHSLDLLANDPIPHYEGAACTHLVNVAEEDPRIFGAWQVQERFKAAMDEAAPELRQTLLDVYVTALESRDTMPVEGLDDWLKTQLMADDHTRPYTIEVVAMAAREDPRVVSSSLDRLEDILASDEVTQKTRTVTIRAFMLLLYTHPDRVSSTVRDRLEQLAENGATGTVAPRKVKQALRGEGSAKQIESDSGADDAGAGVDDTFQPGQQ